MSKKPYSALLFDLDQTLIDFNYAEQQSLELVYKKFYEGLIAKDSFISLFHRINQQLWIDVEQGCFSLAQIGVRRFELISQSMNQALNSSQIADTYEVSLGESSRWLPDAEQSIQELHLGHKLGVITNGLSRVQKIKYKKFSIHQWCQSYIISEEVGISKPSKEIFLRALDEMHIPKEETLMIGDSLSSDYQGALNAGLDFCWVNSGNKSLPAHFPQPQYMVKSVCELAGILPKSSDITHSTPSD